MKMICNNTYTVSTLGKLGLARFISFSTRLYSFCKSNNSLFNLIRVLVSMAPDLMECMNASKASTSSDSKSACSENKIWSRLKEMLTFTGDLILLNSKKKKKKKKKKKMQQFSKLWKHKRSLLLFYIRTSFCLFQISFYFCHLLLHFFSFLFLKYSDHEITFSICFLHIFIRKW